MVSLRLSEHSKIVCICLYIYTNMHYTYLLLYTFVMARISASCYCTALGSIFRGYGLPLPIGRALFANGYACTCLKRFPYLRSIMGLG
jgi:hypothetical protein